MPLSPISPVLIVAGLHSVQWFLQSVVPVLFIVHLFDLQAVREVLEFRVCVLADGQLRVWNGLVEVCAHV